MFPTKTEKLNRPETALGIDELDNSPAQLIHPNYRKETDLRHKGNNSFHPITNPKNNSAPTLSSLLGALKRRWMLALSLAVIASALTFVLAWLIVPTKYLAYATVQVAMAK